MSKFVQTNGLAESVVIGDGECQRTLSFILGNIALDGLGDDDLASGEEILKYEIRCSLTELNCLCRCELALDTGNIDCYCVQST